jgi:regulator of replication initiation timing
MDDNDAVTIWLISILAILIGTGLYRIWQGELRTPALMRQVNDLQHQNAYLQTENARLSPQFSNPSAPLSAPGWFERLLWGSELAPNANIVQQQNISLLRRIGTLYEQNNTIQQQFDALQQHNGDLEQQNDDLRSRLGNSAALGPDNLEQFSGWFADQIVRLREGIKERDSRA